MQKTAYKGFYMPAPLIERSRERFKRFLQKRFSLRLHMALILGGNSGAAILSDAAFQAVLSTSLIRRIKKMSEPDWVGGIFKATAVPFLVVIFCAFSAAWAAHHAYPQAAKMSDVLHNILH